MRLHFIVKSVVAFGLCAFLTGLAFPQERSTGSPTKAAPKNRYDLMSPMGRVAHAIATARAHQPNMGNGRSFRAQLDFDSDSDTDTCSTFDDDCSEEGYQEGPGSTQSEMAIAIDPSGMHIVVGFNDFRGFIVSPLSISGFAYSSDGGLTFTDGQQLPNVTLGQINGTPLPQVSGDPDVKYVPGGAGCQFVYSSILVAGLGTPPNYTGAVQTMAVHRSTDCGITWSGPFIVPSASNPTGVLTGTNARDAADKE